MFCQAFRFLAGKMNDCPMLGEVKLVVLITPWLNCPKGVKCTKSEVSLNPKL